MKTKMILMAFVLCMFGGRQAFCVENGFARDTTKKTAADTTVHKKVSMQINSAEDLQKLIQMLMGSMTAKAAGDSSKIKVESDPANPNHKNVKIQINSAEDLQKLVQMFGGGMTVKQQADTSKQQVIKLGNSSVKITKSETTNERWFCRPVLNMKAPEIVVEKWANDKAPETDGKFILLNLWGFQCPPCIKAIPVLNGISKQFKRDLVVIGLTSDGMWNREPAIEYYNGWDRKGVTNRDLNLHVKPYTLIIDPKGIVRWEGSPNDEKLAEIIKELIGKYK